MLRTIRSAAAVPLLLMTMAACSATAGGPDGVASLASDAPGSINSPASSASLDPQAAQLAFAKCMREHGVDMPNPEASGGGADGAVRFDGRGAERETFETAMEACDPILEQAGAFRGEMDPEMLDKMVEFTQCMRDNGIAMPDPNAAGGISIQRNDNGSVTNGNGGNIDPESEEFQAADEACRPILGAGFGLRTDSSSPGGGGPGVQTAPDATKP